jgi:two-component system, chemotaxis family, CheB/CheR fusion protein
MDENYQSGPEQPAKLADQSREKDATGEQPGSPGLPGPETGNQDVSQLFPVVGIGASAGGLEALRGFLEAIPGGPGAALVVVVHLSPEHHSLLAELLQPHTQMPVTQVTDLVKMEPNHVYVIPPNRNLSSIDTHLRLSPLEESRQARAPIDHFFRTLARTHDSKAVGIVLSGSGSDGAVGLKAIKEAGGLILAQDPVEAAFDGMPQSAIATGIVDDVLAVGEMADRLLTYFSTEPVLVLPDEALDKPGVAVGREDALVLQRIFARLRTLTGHDFSRYKRGTVGRRMARRMQLHGLTSLQAYLELLRDEPDEAHALFKDLLIVVTNFFREPATFAALAEEVIPRLFEGKGRDDEVRVWVPGCATGEEAYSLAILLLEHAARLEARPSIQIFATDLSKQALVVGREGVYPEAIAADVSLERLERFFVHSNGAYRVREDVRELVLFAPHSLLRDPPFSHLDLISCRNLLIYLQRDVQRQVLELFHYALQPGGFLFLGTSERVDERDLFSATSADHSMYRRQDVSSADPRLPSLPLASLTEVQPHWGEEPRSQRRQAANYGALHQRVAERYAPPSLLVDENHHVVHLSERAGRYLQHPGGEVTDNALRLVREELQAELAIQLYRAFHQQSGSRSDPVAMALEGRPRAVSLYVEPLLENGQRFALVCFLETDGSDAARAAGSDAGRDDLVRELEEELAAIKQQLRAAVEEFESSKEEMRASNEELQSMNEELRSTTEELETSKEELQSINEELVTVNEENKNKVQELSQMTADLQNLLAATDIATLFLDRELRIQRFTPAASRLFNIRHSDRGRPLAHLTHKLVSYDGLIDDAERVLRTLAPVEQEVADGDALRYFLRIRPYRTADDRIDGVVITLVDITSLHEAERALARSRERYRLLVDSAQEYAMFTMDSAGRIDSWNTGARRILGYEEDEILGQPAAVIFTPEDRESGAVERELRIARQEGQAINERWHIRQDGSRFWGSGVVTSLWDDGELGGYAKVMRDNTTRKEAEEALRQSEERYRTLAEMLEDRVEERTAQVRQLASELVASEQRVRHRIARTLHDDLQQMLYAAEMQLQFLREDAAREVQDGLEEVLELVTGSLGVTRQLTVELSPPVLKGEGLPEALAWLANYMHEVYGLQVLLEVTGDPQMDYEEQRILLFQIVRELLFNVVKHASVRQARVTLREAEDGIVLAVSDEGKGFDVPAVLAEDNGGFGLYNVRERLGLFGGAVDIDSKPGDGTRVSLFLPRVTPDPPEQLGRADPPAGKSAAHEK